jgi:hypothetical protein
MEETLKKLEDVSDTSSEIANTWNSSHEILLAAIGDKANCMRWMHTHSQLHYERLNFWFTIPSITVTALAGSATIALPRFLEDQQQVATVVIGCLTIASGLLTSINQFMKTPQFSEGHRIASLAYSKLHRIISSELALRRDQRTPARGFLKMVRMEQDRLEESSPLILDSIIQQFNQKVESNITLEKPEIVGDLDHIAINTAVRSVMSLNELLPRSRKPPTGGYPRIKLTTIERAESIDEGPPKEVQAPPSPHVE